MKKMTPQQHYEATMIAVNNLRLHALNAQFDESAWEMMLYQEKLVKIERFCERMHDQLQTLRDRGISR